MSWRWSLPAGTAVSRNGGDIAVRILAWLRGLDVEQLAELCRTRTEVCRRPPQTIEELARRLSDPDSVAATVAGLDRDALLVAQSVVVLGDGCQVASLRTFVRDPNEVLDVTLSRLAGLALVWPGERAGTLRFSAALGRYWDYPLDRCWTISRPGRGDWVRLPGAGNRIATVTGHNGPARRPSNCTILACCWPAARGVRRNSPGRPRCYCGDRTGGRS